MISDTVIIYTYLSLSVVSYDLACCVLVSWPRLIRFLLPIVPITTDATLAAINIMLGLQTQGFMLLTRLSSETRNTRDQFC